MSSPQPSQPAQQASAKAPVEDRLTFPPFPQAPPGVTIIPFKQFKEHGIQMFATDGDDDVERDGLGIPTTELRVHHDTDFCKTETKRKRKAQKREQFKTSTIPGARKEWWQHWEEAEDLRSTRPYNPNTSPLDRLYDAAAEFRKGRAWPPSPTGISALWDQFRLYVGLLSNTPVWKRTDKPQQEAQSDSDDDDFDEEDGLAQGTKTNVIEADFEREPRKYLPRVLARPPYALYDAQPIPVGSDEEVKHLLDGENARREECMVDFLNDPELKMKIFLSSYIRKQGLIWTDRNLVNIPRLLGFFIRFLLRSNVFPEQPLLRGLQRTLEVVNLAQKELILTSKLAKELPDKFSLACTSCFGQKADGYKPIAPIMEEKEAKDRNTAETNDDIREPDPKRPRLDLVNKDLTEAAKSAVEQFEEELKADNVEVIRVDDALLMKDAAKRQVIQDNMDPLADAVPGWTESTWGSTPADDAIPNWAELSSWGNAPATGESDPWAIPPIEWAPPDVHSLLPLLGPTGFPLTHTTGAVECSIRRIKSFTPPPASNTLPKSPISGDEPEEDPDAVDIELERRFAKLVLAPWPGWDKANDEMPHLAKPRILETSRGPIVGVVQPDGQVDQDAMDLNTTAIPEGVTPHDPFKDDITVWVEPAILPALSPGLGLGGTWVQISRQQDFAGEGGKKKKKKKGKSKKVAPRYWYIDELMMILPSYHT
ncbi:hypothetical protein Hypma_013006 [Hypsizygus marmoreus]|uniref:Uncharacterized protein n=1 Tax=Hypsizygus marmoreus TaxID=39966 RepID=A0A369JJC8_HYPMA|nr:hypothetical protein Hypma_013006 [Hypsizygus marmoreus]